MGRSVALVLCGLFLFVMILSVGCGSEETSASDGGRTDAATIVPENTAARCQDSIDNDGDGLTDCQDPDCWALSFCVDAGGKDGPAGDGAKPDAPADLGPIDGVPDLPQSLDGPSNDAPPVSCAAHCDCPQGQFCYYGTCLFDPKMPVYCCAKTGCPPGRWCFETGGATGTCAESTSHPCQDACDCGPAHCCKKDPSKPPTDPGHCVKDTVDLWNPGGTVVGNLGTCAQGTDATYCCADPQCHAGKYAYGIATGTFRCFDRTVGGTRQFCSGVTCFGTVCNCDPGESCVDLAAETAVVGKACGLFTGGSCVSNAVAEAVYGLSAADLLPCCGKGCVNGQKCEVGWRSDGEYAYARVVGVCGGSCGNGTCDPGETAVPNLPNTCTADCTFPLSGTPKCGIPGELNVVWSNPTICGDGICDKGATACDWSKAESCKTCPQDCGVCDWEIVAGAMGRAVADISGVWGSSATDVFAVGADGGILHYGGTGWKVMDSGTKHRLHGVWGSSASAVFAVGEQGIVLRYDGKSWTTVVASAGPGSGKFLGDVWGSSASNVYAVGSAGTILHHDGTDWTSVTSGTPQNLSAIWGSSASDVYAVGAAGTILHYDGTAWSPMTSGTSQILFDVWGSSAGNVYAVGDAGTILHYDGTAWSPMTSGTPEYLTAIWGSSASDVYAVGVAGTILHFDGVSWTTMASGASVLLRDVWGSSSNNIFAVGWPATIWHNDGTGWTTVTSDAAETASAVWGSSASDIFGVGPWGCILHDDGAGWKPMSSGTTTFLQGVWGSSPTDVFAVGYQGTVLRYDGTSWTPMVSGSTTILWDVWGSSSSDVFAVGGESDSSATILHFDGTSWAPMSHNATEILFGVWGSSPSDVFAVGIAGTIFHYDGTSWDTMASTVMQRCYRVWGSSASNVFVVGESGGIAHHDGTSWKAMASGTQQNLFGLWGGSASNVFAVGASGTMLHYDGAGWSPVTSADFRDPISTSCVALSGIGGVENGEVAVGGQGVILRRHCPGGVCPKPPPPPPPSDAGVPDAFVPPPDTQPPTPVCGNTTCELTESCDGQSGTTPCPSDCPGLTTGPPKNQYCCVNGACIGQGCPVPGCP